MAQSNRVVDTKELARIEDEVSLREQQIKLLRAELNDVKKLRDKLKRGTLLTPDRSEQARPRRAEIYKLRNLGYTYVAIAKKFGISSSRAQELYRREKQGIERDTFLAQREREKDDRSG